MRPLITNIQRFCVHDGPGIRTTVFFKGCSLHCPWCANPENISCNNEIFYYREMCRKECEYYNEVDLEKKCIFFESKEPNCLYGAIEQIGRYYTEENLFKELIKDEIYYGDEGGITFSGGEPLLFLPYYENVFKMLRKNKINCCVETSLFVSHEKIDFAIEKIDVFYVDIKIVNKEKCHDILGGDINLFLTNLDNLSRNRRGNLIYRIPIVPGYTDNEENLIGIIKLIIKYPPDKVHIFSVHNLARKKYECLRKPYNDWCSCDSCRLNDIAERIKKAGVSVDIITI